MDLQATMLSVLVLLDAKWNTFVDAHSVTVIELDAEVDVTPVYGCTDQTATNLMHLRQKMMARVNIHLNQFSAVRIARLQILMLRQQKMMAVVSTIQILVMCSVMLVLKDGPQYQLLRANVVQVVRNQVRPTKQTRQHKRTKRQTNQRTNRLQTTKHNYPIRAMKRMRNQSNSGEMKTCEGCCGDGFEVAADEPCPVVDCAPCETEGTRTRNHQQ